jgi:hypothetical protein
MPGKLKKSNVFFAHGVQDADGARPSCREPQDGAPGAAQVALQRPHVFGGVPEMLLKEPF